MRLQTIARVKSALIRTDRLSSSAHQYARKTGLEIKISQGIYLSRSFLLSAKDHWHMQELVSAARIIATHIRMGDIVFCKDSALFLYGIQAKQPCPDVYVRSDHAYGRHLNFPAVRLDGELILPSGKVRMCHATLTHSERKTVGGMECVGPVQLLVECTSFRNTRDALASASSLLSALVRDPLLGGGRGKEGAEALRAEAFRGVEGREGFPGRRRSGRIIEAASLDCDSLAEAYLVALLHEEKIYGWKQQYEVRTSSGVRFIDCAFPDKGIGIEIEGKVKDSLFLRSATDGHVAYYNRAAELSLLGWRVIPIPAADVLYSGDKAAETIALALKQAKEPSFLPYVLNPEHY